jgi:hypothetical protein
MLKPTNLGQKLKLIVVLAFYFALSALGIVILGLHWAKRYHYVAFAIFFLVNVGLAALAIKVFLKFQKDYIIQKYSDQKVLVFRNKMV